MISIPNADPSIVGIISLRGTIVTLLDARRKLRHPPAAAPGIDTRINVLEHHGETVGFEVDRVLRVVKTDSGAMNIAIPGDPSGIEVNRYVVSKGEEQSLVIYWYQTPYRVIADEIKAKVYTIVDGLRYHRSDTSLVRVIVPITLAKGEDAAEKEAVSFIQGFFRPVREYLPL